MKLYFHGHDYKYAAEQMLLTLFPGQRPEYPEQPPEPGEDALALSLHRGETWATATAALTWGGGTYRAARRCRVSELTDKLSADRALQRILKLAFYDAGTAALGREPPWGALTGVRPVKIPAKAMAAGATPAQAERLLRDTYRVSPDRRRLAMDCAGASLAAQRSLADGEVSLSGTQCRIHLTNGGEIRLEGTVKVNGEPLEAMIQRVAGAMLGGGG